MSTHTAPTTTHLLLALATWTGLPMVTSAQEPFEFVDSGQALGDSQSRSIALGDLDGDGDLDAMVGNLNAANTVWTNDGNGTFTNSGQALGNSSSWSVALGDLDGDGDLDAMVANDFQPNTVWTNDGTGTFTNSGQALGNRYSQSVALGDLDGDGDLDAMVANNGTNTVWTNDGNGTFTSSGQTLGNRNSYSVTLGDLDGDGDLDAMVANCCFSPNTVWTNDGNGTFTSSGQTLGNRFSTSVALGDLDGDGDLDAMVANSNQPNTVWTNQPLTTATLTVCEDGGCDFTSIQDAINAAGFGDTVEIQDGTFLLDGGINLTDKSITLRGRTDPVTGEPTTILDGSLNKSSGSVINSPTDVAIPTLENLIVQNFTVDGNSCNTLVTWFSGGEITNCVFRRNQIDGGCGNDFLVGLGFVTVTNCRFSENISYDASITLAAGDTELINCLFDDNEVFGFSSSTLQIYSSESVSVSGCTFRSNTSENFGGAVAVQNSSFGLDPQVPVTFSSCTFEDNRASQGGGAVYIPDLITGPVFHQCTFRGNQAPRGGAVEQRGGTLFDDCLFENNAAQVSGAINATDRFGGLQLTVSNSTFRGNQAVLAGGAIGTEGGAEFLLENNLFESNQAPQGGAIVVQELSNPTCTNNTFRSNEATLGAGVYVDASCRISLDGDLFEANRAYYGAGVRNFGGSCTLTGVTMRDNVLLDTQNVFDAGSAILNREGVVTVSGSTFQNNSVAGSTNYSIASVEGIVFLLDSVVCGTDGADPTFQIIGAWVDEGGNCVQVTCSDCIDKCPDDPDKTEPGLCGCGTPDTDGDGDGTPDCLDDCPDDPAKTAPGQCGCGIPDTDGDQDGLADCVDPCPAWANDCSEDGLTYFFTTTIEEQGTTLQMALDGVPNGGTVLVAPGTYSGPIDFGGRSISLASELGAEQTVIDGSELLDGSIVSFLGGEGPETLLSGFTLANGTIGTLSSEGAMVGGAIVCRDSSPTITDCRFTGNAADLGGAVHCSGGTPVFSDCAFEDNLAGVHGGAMLLARTTAIVERSNFTGNLAGSDGGAIHAVRGSPLLRQLIIGSNTATNNGGGVNYGSYGEGPLLVNGCVITGNASLEGVGGGIHFEEVSVLPVVVGTTVCENTPGNLAGGEYVDSGGNTICAPPCPTDLDGDGTVDGADLTLVLADWGCSGSDCIGDFDGSGVVNGADLTIFLSAWGDCLD